MPSRHQCVLVGEEGIHNLAMPEGVLREQRTAHLDLIASLDRSHLERHSGNSELEARLRSDELAC